MRSLGKPCFTGALVARVKRSAFSASSAWLVAIFSSIGSGIVSGSNLPHTTVASSIGSGNVSGWIALGSGAGQNCRGNCFLEVAGDVEETVSEELRPVSSGDAEETVAEELRRKLRGMAPTEN